MTDTQILQAIVRHRLMVDVEDGETTVCALTGTAVTVVHDEDDDGTEALRHAVEIFTAQLETKQ